MAPRRSTAKPRKSSTPGNSNAAGKPRTPKSRMPRKGGASASVRQSRGRLHIPANAVKGDVVRYAVVGQGYFAQAAVLPAFAKARNSKLVALVSDDEAKLRSLSRKYGAARTVGYDGYDDLLYSGDIDAVYIALPNDMHRDFAVRAATAGIHVLTEKPMAMTPEDCRAMIDAAERNNVRLMVAYRLHFEPCNLAAIEAVRKRRIGDARYFSSVFTMPVARGNIRTQVRHGGGPLFDIGIYCVNAARYLFRDEPIDVMARMASGRDPRFREVEETVSAILTFPGDRIATFTASFGASSVASYSVGGTKGTITVDHAYEFQSGMTLEEKVGERTRTRKFAKRDQVAPELIHFSDCVLSGHDPLPSGKEGLIDVEILHAIQESAATGRRVLVGGPERGRRPSQRMAAGIRPPGRTHLVKVQVPHED